MARKYTRAEMRAFARDRLENPEPMVITGRRAEGEEVVEIRPGEFRLRQTIPAHLEVTQLREPRPAPFRVYVTDDWDSTFEGSAGTPYDNWADAEAAAKAIAPGYRSYVDDATGACILKVVHEPEKHVFPW